MKNALGIVPALCTLSLLPLACGGSNEPATAQVPAELARLVPPDAVLYAHMASMEQFDAALEALATALPEEAAAELRGLDPLELLLQGDHGLIDRSRPVGIALSMAGIPTVMVPSDDPEACANSFAAQPGATSAVEGGYVGISPLPSYVVAEGPSSLVSGLPAGAISLRVDLASLIESTRPTIDQGLADLRQQMTRDMQGMSEMMAFDPAQVMDLYIDGIEAVIDSAERLDYTIGVQDGTLELQGNLVMRQGSALDGFGAGQVADVQQLASRLDFAETGVAVMAMDLEALVEPLRPLLNRVVEMYPEPARETMAVFIQSYEELMPLFGDGTAVSGSFDERGMRLVYQFNSSDPEGLLAAYRDVVGRASTAGEVELFGPAVQETFEGVELTRYRMSLDQLVGVSGSQGTETETAMQALFGEDGLEFVMAGGDDTVTMVLGGDETYLRGALERADGGATLPADFARALERVEGLTPAFVGRLDVASLMRGAFGLVSGMGVPVPPLPEDLPEFHATAYYAVAGREWRGGMSIELDELKAFVAAVDEATR